MLVSKYMKKLYTLLASVALLFSYAGAQSLEELQVTPKTEIAKEQDSIKSELLQIEVPIPELQLNVNHWKHWTKFGINANQASFSDNWKGGGVNSVSLLGIAWHKAEYNKNDFLYVSEIDLKYGKAKNKGQIAKKNNDRIFWDNKLSYKLSPKWSLYTSITFETQFDIGPEYGKDSLGNEIQTGVKTSFMAPGYLTESFGLEYNTIDKTFSLRFGTGTARQTFVYDERIAPDGDGKRFGVEEGKNIKNDLAFQVTANLDRDLAKNFNVKSRYNLFADYKDVSDPSHRLDVTFTANVTRIINVSLSGIMIYDSDVDPNVQYSQALAMGITFNFPR